jgi:hypothetical protein
MDRFTRLAAALVLLAVPAPAFAQSRPGPSIVGEVEYARITEDDGYLGAGFGGGGGVRFHLTDATSVGVDISRTHHVRDLGFYATAYDAAGRLEAFPFTERWEGNATWLLGTISHAFGSGRVRPLVWGGGGMMWHDGTSSGPLTMPQIPAGFTVQPGTLDSHSGQSVSAFAADGGVGVEVRLSDRMAIAPFAGLRLANTGNFGPKYIVRGGARIVFRL